MTAKTDISKCLSLLFGKLKLCIFLSFIVLCLLLPTANYDLAIIEDYLAGNAKSKYRLKTKWRRCHIWRALATVANRKCGPGNRHNTRRFRRCCSKKSLRTTDDAQIAHIEPSAIFHTNFPNLIGPLLQKKKSLVGQAFCESLYL